MRLVIAIPMGLIAAALWYLAGGEIARILFGANKSVAGGYAMGSGLTAGALVTYLLGRK